MTMAKVVGVTISQSYPATETAYVTQYSYTTSYETVTLSETLLPSDFVIPSLLVLVVGILLLGHGISESETDPQGKNRN